jgi:ATP-dependent Clp protease adapter protein ClpS
VTDDERQVLDRLRRGLAAAREVHATRIMVRVDDLGLLLCASSRLDITETQIEQMAVGDDAAHRRTAHVLLRGDESSSPDPGRTSS